MRYEWRQAGLIFSQSCSCLGLGFRIFCSWFHPWKERHHLGKTDAFLLLSPGISEPHRLWMGTPSCPPEPCPGLSLSQKWHFPLPAVTPAQDSQRGQCCRAAVPAVGRAAPQVDLACSQVKGNKGSLSLEEAALQLCCSFLDSPPWEGTNSPQHLCLPKQTAGIIELIPHLLAD